jgi:hypothetical protein
MIAMLHTISASNSSAGNAAAPLGDWWIIQTHQRQRQQGHQGPDAGQSAERLLEASGMPRAISARCSNPLNSIKSSRICKRATGAGVLRIKTSRPERP